MGNSLSGEEINRRLHEAAERGDLKELQKYLKKGGDLNKLIDNENFQKPQSIKPECQSEKGEAFNSLVASLAADSSLDGKSSVITSASEMKDLRMNALHRAASRKNNRRILQYVLKHISNVDEQDSHGDSALHYVSMFHNNDETLAMLLKFRPNINLQNDHGDTALYSAIVRGCDLKVIEWLLKGGANPNICNIDGDTPLHSCAMRRGIDPLIPGILLRFGANPNLKNRSGQTPLHVAAETTNNAVLLLLKFNAKVRLRDNNGRRPSEVAASEEIRKVLLEEENDLLERTVRVSDIIAREESQVFACSPVASAKSVQRWLNNQNSIDSTTEYERNGSLKSENGRNSQTIYPKRTPVLESRTSNTRASVGSVDSYLRKFEGGGGHGVIYLPNDKEIIIPPDAMPLGTTMEITISSNNPDIAIPDLSSCDFKFNVNIRLPGKQLQQQHEEGLSIIPAFTGMCLEGDTKWLSMRNVESEVSGDNCVRFSLFKEKSVPLTKRPPSIRITAPLPPDVEDDGHEGGNSDTGSSSTRVTIEADEPVESQTTSEAFWSRQIVILKETSETSESCEGSEAESFADEDYLKVPEDSSIAQDSLEYDEEFEQNIRIQHPIDQELATITEEDISGDTETVGDHSPPNHNHISRDNGSPMESAELYLASDGQKIQESTLSLDSGYRDSIDCDEY